MAQVELPAALQDFEEGLDIVRDLAARDPGNAGWARDVSVSLNKVGDVRVAQGDLPAALQAFEESLSMRRDLAARDPGNAGWARDVSVSWERVAGIAERQGDAKRAVDAWQQALTISGTLAERFPDSVDLQTTPVVHLAGLARLADVATADGRAMAKEHLERAVALLRPLAEAGTLDAQRAGWVGVIEGELAKLDR